MYLVPALRGDEKVMYLRKSRADDPLASVEEVLAKHEQMLDEWVQKNQPEGGPVPETHRYREVVSGETLESRPKMQALLRLIESPKIKAVVCVEPQRLSRGDYEDIGRLVKLLRYSNTLVITLQYTYDLNDDRDRDLFERELKRGNEFLEYQKKIMNNGRLLAVSNGNFITGTAPYGYRKVSYKEGRRTCHTLEPIPEQADVVRMIFKWYKEGLGTVKIADRLDAWCVPAPRGKQWARESLWDMLDNPHYIGKVVWGKNKAVKKVVDGKVITSYPDAEDYLIFEGKHPAIVDMETWEAVKKRRGKIPRNTKTKNLYNPMAGLIICKNCGRYIQARSYITKEGKAHCAPRFLCPNRRRCGTGSALMSDVLPEISKALREAIADFEVRIEQGTDDSAQVHRQLVERLEKRLEELRDLERKQWDEKIKGQIPQHVFESLNKETVAEIEEVGHALCEAKDAKAEPIDLKDRVVTFKAALEALEDPDAPVKEKNQLLKACIERIVYDREATTPKGRRGGDDRPISLDITLRV